MSRQYYPLHNVFLQVRYDDLEDFALWLYVHGIADRVSALPTEQQEEYFLQWLAATFVPMQA